MKRRGVAAVFFVLTFVATIVPIFSVLAGSCSCLTSNRSGVEGSTCTEDIASEAQCTALNGSSSGGTIYSSCTFYDFPSCKTLTCGSGPCQKSNKVCNDNRDCTQYGGVGYCAKNICYLDSTALLNAQKTPGVTGYFGSTVNLKEPSLTIRIPGVNFTDVKDTVDAEGYIHLPWIGEYIAGIYKFLVGIASILAVFMIVINGARIVISAGGEGQATAYHKIGQVITGLVILWGSYLILYTINPDLTRFEPFKIKYITPQDLPEDQDNMEDAEFPVLPNVKKPDWTATTFDCDKKYEPAGVVPEASVIQYTCPGLSGKVKTIPAMKDALCKAAALAAADGYTMAVGPLGSYRPFQDQVSGWCGPGVNDYKDPNERKIYRAIPGFSNHGLGQAIDVVLYKNGKALFTTSGSGQCSVDPQIVAKLANYFYSASSNFVRYDNEIWHFEYGSTGQKARSKTTSLPDKCKK